MARFIIVKGDKTEDITNGLVQNAHRQKGTQTQQQNSSHCLNGTHYTNGTCTTVLYMHYGRQPPNKISSKNK